MSERWPSWQIDLAVFAFMVVVAVLGTPSEPPPGLRAPDELYVALQAIQLLALLTWRRWPAWTLFVMTLTWAFERNLAYDLSTTTLIPAVVLFGIAATLPPRRSARLGWPVAVFIVAFTLAGVWLGTNVGPVELVAAVGLTAVPILFGRWWRRAEEPNGDQTNLRPMWSPLSFVQERPGLADAILVVGLGGASIISGVLALGPEFDEGFEAYRRPDALFWMLQALQVGALTLRRRRPTAAVAIATGAWIVERLLTYITMATTLVLPVLLYSLSAHAPRAKAERLGWTAIMATTGFTAIGWALDPTVGAAEFLSMVAITVVPFLWGRRTIERSMRLELAELRAEQAEREREERATQAVAAERARIARELHDVVAHQMTVMTLQAEGARRLAGDSDPRVGAALDTIREAGHEALREMRMMVGLLRSTDSDQALAPQPGLHQLEELVAGMSEAGLDVDLEVVGSGPDLPDGIELSAYRIVQEALTNSLKHGGPSVTAKVSIHRLPHQLEIEVVDDGRGITARSGAGHGLVGMRERVALVGGTLEAGPRAGGGYRVHALLPLEHT